MSGSEKTEALEEKIFKTQLSAAILIMENLITKLDKVGLEDRVEEAKEDGQFKWGMDLFEIYKLSLKFYKGKKKLMIKNFFADEFHLFFLQLDKSGKAVHLSYEDNLKLVALTMQASHGPLVLMKLQPLGVFDVIGKDRRNQWAILGKKS